MSEAKKTKRCPYCGGSGKRPYIAYPNGEWAPRTPLFNCTDCAGSGQRCILCCKPAVDCECPASAFDGDYSGMDRPVR